jgi:hypothetical protein
MTRRQRSLKDDDEVLAALEDAGIDRERLLSVDREKVDEALDVVSVPESAVYDTDESEYVRKAEVDEERKETLDFLLSNQFVRAFRTKAY